MPADTAPRRLHPASVLFNLARAIRFVGVPFLFAVFGSGARDWSAVFWALVLMAPGAVGLAAAILQYFRFTYQYGDDELVVRSGVVFRRERHIPYNRIHNIDASQNLAQRLIGVYAVAIETGGGADAEATLRVLPAAALGEMRQRVFKGRGMRWQGDGQTDADAAPMPPASDEEMLLQLSLRDLAVCGLVRGRGLLLLGAIASVLFDFVPDPGLDTGTGVGTRPVPGSDPASRGRFVQALRGLAAGISFDAGQVLAALLLLILLVALLRALSMIYTMQRLYGFTLVLAGGELRMAYGALTRVRATIPLRRIQTLTVREGPLHRLFGVCSVRADTAGGEMTPGTSGTREWLAPLIDRRRAPAFVRRLMPEADLASAAWHPPHPRALRRALVKPLLGAAMLSLALGWYAGAGAITAAVILALAAAAVGHARLRVKHMRHALSGDAFMYRSGWFWRHLTVAPVRKVQVVSMYDSPFDRRNGMAGLSVDTAGAAGSPHRLELPYLARDRAAAIAAALAGSAAQSPLHW